MRIAVVGSRSLTVNEEMLDKHLSGAEEIVSGGAKGIDMCAAEYAKRHNIKLVEFLPEYERFGRAAPILRNKEIVKYADKIIVFWDGRSRGSLSVINYARSLNKDVDVIIPDIQ